MVSTSSPIVCLEIGPLTRHILHYTFISIFPPIFGGVIGDTTIELLFDISDETLQGCRICCVDVSQPTITPPFLNEQHTAVTSVACWLPLEGDDSVMDVVHTVLVTFVYNTFGCSGCSSIINTPSSFWLSQSLHGSYPLSTLIA